MDLWRISVSTTSEAADAVSVALEEVGAIAVEIEDRTEWERKLHSPQFGEWVWEKDYAELVEGAIVRGYFEHQSDTIPDVVDQPLQARLEPLRTCGLDTGSLRYEWSEVTGESYLHAWKSDYHAVSVSDKLTIVPSWEQCTLNVNKDHIYLFIDPGVAFGTGTHQTTVLCLRAEEKWINRNIDVLDIGTGTGILAIAAAKLGARKVLATDLDEVAVRVAQENIHLNDVSDRVEVLVSDLLCDVPEHRYHLITANLLADIVLRVLPDLDAYLAPGGIVLFSGIVKTQVERVIQAMNDAQLEQISADYMDDWAVISGHKRG